MTALTPKGLQLDVLVDPLLAVLERASAFRRQRVVVGSSVELSFFDEVVFDQRVQIGVESPVGDWLVDVAVDVVEDLLSLRTVHPRDDVQQVALKAGELIHGTL